MTMSTRVKNPNIKELRLVSLIQMIESSFSFGLGKVAIFAPSTTPQALAEIIAMVVSSSPDPSHGINIDLFAPISDRRSFLETYIVDGDWPIITTSSLRDCEYLSTLGYSVIHVHEACPSFVKADLQVHPTELNRPDICKKRHLTTLTKAEGYWFNGNRLHLTRKSRVPLILIDVTERRFVRRFFALIKQRFGDKPWFQAFCQNTPRWDRLEFIANS